MRTTSDKLICGLHCGREFEPYEGMRTPSVGSYWCKPCQDEFDQIDWEEVNEHRRELGRPPVEFFPQD